MEIGVDEEAVATLLDSKKWQKEVLREAHTWFPAQLFPPFYFLFFFALSHKSEPICSSQR